MARRATLLTGNTTEDDGPTFYHIIFPRFVMHPLRIPAAFRRHLLRDETEIASLTLSNCSERSWPVSVSKVGTEIDLKDGWQDFVRDNSLGDKQFLQFEYLKKMRFIVTNFEKTGVSRDPPTYCQCNTEISLPLGSPPRGGRLRSSAVAAAAAFNSDFPYFSKVIGRSHMVVIPTEFYQKHFAAKYGKGDELILGTSEGEFSVKLSPVGETMMMSGGWTGFRGANRFQVDDVIVFELVGQNTMEVHIFQN